MLKEFIDRIVELSNPVIDTIACRNYSSKPIFPIKEPEPSYLTVNTLTGFVGFIESNIDGLSPETLLIHISGHDRVYLHSNLNPLFNQRFMYLTAAYSPGYAFQFGHFYLLENFIINLQSAFIDDLTIRSILSIVGNLKDEYIKQISDDGVTQSVTVKSGLAKVENVDVPNPVTLRPYRTFFEVEQPESQFILRLKQGSDGGMPVCALFEADGGLWQITAMRAIFEYLSSKIKDIAIIW